MARTSQQPGEALDEPHDGGGEDRHDLRRIVRHYIVRPLVEAGLFYAFLLVASHVAIARARGRTAAGAGELLDVSPGVVGVLLDLAIVVGTLTAFHILYTLPALMVRKWLGATLKFLMYGLFVIFLGWMHFTKFVALRIEPDGKVTVIRPWPQEPATLPPAIAFVLDTGSVRALVFQTGSPEGVSSVAIFHRDREGTARLQAAAKRLGAIERHD
jgi:hypothetical protein